jgi:hypothetical protein
VGAGLAAALIAAATPARALKTEMLGVGTAAGGVQSLEVTSGQALVRFSSGTTDAQVDTSLSSTGVTRLKDFVGGWFLVGWNDDSPVGPRLTALKNVTGVLAVVPSRVYQAFLTPSDPLFNSQYALAQVNAPSAWEYEVGNTNRVTIAVIDSGIDHNQPDLAAKLANTTSRGFDPTSGGALAGQPSTPACNHATRVAGVAAASTNNGTLVAGLSWGAQLVSYKVFLDADCNTDINCGSGSCRTNDPAIIAALNQAVTDATVNAATYGRVVVNMSLGGPGVCDPVGPLQAAITNAVNNNVIVVAATGNGGGAIESPGNCSKVIPMGATDNTDQIASFSSRGPELAANGLVAPGVAVLTTDEGTGTASATGTSFSSPMGAGLAALVVSKKPTWTPAQVQTVMRAGADNIGQPATAQGAGRMNAFRTLRLTVNGSLAGFDGEQKPIAFPNPFRLSQGSTVSISFPQSLHGSGTDIKIYTMTGRIVRELSAPIWDGKNTDGNLVASGAYMFVVKTSAGSSSGRLAVIR